MDNRIKPHRWLRSSGIVAFIVMAMVLRATPAKAIYNGYDAPFKSYRFMVSLRLASAPNAHFCGGTLIAPDIVLTAAHCAKGNKLVAVVGRDTSDWARAPRVAVVDQTEPTTSNIIQSNRDDIALVRLAKRQATPIISMANSEPPVNAHVETAGWGCTNKPLACTKSPNTLQASHQTVLGDRDCGTSVFWKPPMFAPTSICTTNAKSTVNHGDSGGPLLISNGKGGFTQVGVTSLAADNPKKLDGAFISIPAERAWINSAIRRLHQPEDILPK
jgi:secreted trypsin-like serine protease